MVATALDSSPKNRFLLVYGSETGQAKAIAQDIADKSSAHGLTADLQDAEGVDRKFKLVNEPLLVLVSSTTGEGEPPNNIAKMLRRLRNKALKEDHLANLSYTILGLGDTNYTQFCQCPKDFHSRFQALGARTFYEPGWADDGIGLDVVCDPWIEGLWPALKKETARLAQATPTGVVKSADAIEEKTKPLSKSDTAVTIQTAPTPSSSAAASSQSIVTSKPPTVASLTRSIAPLSGASLSVPAESPPFLSVSWCQQVEKPFDKNHNIDEQDEQTIEKIHNGVPFPSATSEIFKVPVLECCRLTSDDAVKTALDVCIGTSGTPLEHFRPGDAFAVVVRNPKPEVDLLLNRLFPVKEGVEEINGENVTSSSSEPSPESTFTLAVLPNTTKVKAEVPAFIQEFVTPRYVFENLLDIRSVPKKGFLRMLALYCDDELEKRRLLELSSKQGAKDYDAFVRQPGLGFLDILIAFPSLRPPLERIIENLPRLQARSYSISSSPLRCPGRAHFVFNIVEFDIPAELGLGKTRRGICTGMIDELTKSSQSQDPPCFEERSSLESATLHLSVFTRPNPWFLHPDDDLSRPLMMVGPGTGVAPFLGFLQHREKLMDRAGLSVSDLGETWLFFGCRHQKRDYLYQTELERLRDRGVLTHLVTTFSRDSGVDAEESPVTDPAAAAAAAVTPKYVQHRILENSGRVHQLLVNATAVVYVCGDAKNMARNVNDALIDVLVKEDKEMSKMSAMKFIADLREQKRYLQDVWA